MLVTRERIICLLLRDKTRPKDGEETFSVFIITDKTKASRGGGKRCRCYERRRGKT